MKKFLSLILVLTAAITAAVGQNADPYISLQTVPSTVSQGTNSVLNVIAGNAGNGTIVANSLRIVLTAGSNAEILGLSGGDPRWTQSSLSAGNGNTLIIRNTGPAQFGSFDLNNVFVTVKGTVVGGPATISGNIAYITANNPLLGGALNASQGNASNTNDNSTTSLTVTFALLVKLNSFAVTANDCTAQLIWTTSREENFRGFDVEHSIDGRTFEKIGSLPASGNSSGSTYRFSNLQTTGKAFYRLKMIDTDGTINYSTAQSVATRCNERTVTIHPNPIFENQSLVVTLSGYTGRAKGELIAITGQLVQAYQLQNGVNAVTVSSALAKGTYQLRVTAENGESQTFKVVKQ